MFSLFDSCFFTFSAIYDVLNLNYFTLTNIIQFGIIIGEETLTLIFKDMYTFDGFMVINHYTSISL